LKWLLKACRQLKYKKILVLHLWLEIIIQIKLWKSIWKILSLLQIIIKRPLKIRKRSLHLKIQIKSIKRTYHGVKANLFKVLLVEMNMVVEKEVWAFQIKKAKIWIIRSLKIMCRFQIHLAIIIITIEA